MSFKLNFLEFNLNLAKQLLKNVKRDPGIQSRFTCTFLVYIIEEPIYPYFFILFFFFFPGSDSGDAVCPGPES